LGDILAAVHRIVAIIGAGLAATRMMTPLGPLCAAAVESESLIIKTVMIKWELEDDK
jgi:hypothetical protein